MGGMTWPLVGRASEVQQLIAHLDAQEKGVMLAGAAGIGKTRMADELFNLAVARGLVPLRVAATKATAEIPLGAFATLLPDLPPNLSRTEMLRRVAEAIAERAAGGRTVLLVDDGHLLDDASAAVVHQLSLRYDVFLIVTTRSGEPVPSPLLALWKDGIIPRLDLGPLEEEEVGQLLVAVLGGPVEASTRRRFFDRSAGNALFLRELLLGAIDAEALQNRNGMWGLERPLPPSARLVELVEARMELRDEHDALVLDLIALGEPVGLGLLERLAGTAETQSLQRRQLVSVRSEGRRSEFTLAHPLYSEVLRRQMSPSRRRSLYRAMAEALAELGMKRRDDLLRVAKWRLEGGGNTEPGVMLEAANRAWMLQDLSLARQLAEAELAANGGFDAALLVGQILSMTGEGEAAERRLAALVDYAASDQAKARLAAARIDNLAYNLGRPDEALVVAEEAEESIGDLAARNEVAAHKLTVLDVGGQTSALIAAAGLCETSSGRTLAWASAMAAWGFGKTGQLSKALELADIGLRAHLELTGPPLPMGSGVHIAIRVWNLTMAGYLEEADTLATTEYARAMEEGAVETQWLMGTTLALLAMAKGEVETADRLARESANLTRDQNRLIFVKSALIPAAESLALSGRTAEADAVMAELRAPDISSIHMLDAEVARVQAWIEASRGDLTGARKCLEEAAATAAAAGDLIWQSAALHDSARLGRPRAVLSQLKDLVRRIEGPLIQARLAHVQALVDSDAHGLGVVSESFEDIGTILLAAEAAADAAVAWQRSGDPRRAKAAERRAVHLAARCEGAQTPGLTTGAQAAAALTRREVEVARLAATGKPNKVIAQMLGLSLRTVENKLHDVYEKLGIFGREDLPDALLNHAPATQAD